MKAIEQIYENYKASLNEETPYTEEQRKEFDSLSDVLDNAISGDIPEDYRKQQQIFEHIFPHFFMLLDIVSGF